ncbi:MAG TPA: type 4a pilus biogenesis protein PilO [Phycisphaerae bacterium]|nr:type 4a pilus biogenesis protein PilO [Phycisphaerae bacterium]HPM25046.1 type 4a pilus biogenesis protein PilO [Phycisphaerae bacterium]
MIVCKRPWTIYDVDVCGAAGLLVLGVATWWIVFAPWGQMWSDYQRFAAARTAGESDLRAAVAELRTSEQALAQLDLILAAESADIPRTDALAGLLRDMTDLAAGADLEVLNVTPQPVGMVGSYLANDIRVDGRGRSQDFIRFLDRLARANPYQSLQACTIGRPARAGGLACELAWTVRLYVLPPTETVGAGGGS